VCNQKLAEARIWAARKLPYMRHQLMALLPVAKPGIGTMCVDEYCRMYFDPAFLEQRDLPHLGFVVLHEVIHVWNKHCRRGVKLLGEKPDRNRLAIWRQAVDASVNDTLEQTGLRCPDEGITPAKLGLPRNKTAEEYFNLLLEKRDKERQEARQQPPETQQSDDSDKGEGQAEQAEMPPEEQHGEREGQGDERSDGDSEQEGDEQGDDVPGDQPGEEGEPGNGEGQGNGEGEGQEGNGEGEPTATKIGGSCADGQQRPWEDGPPSDEHPGMAEHEQNIIEAAVAKEIEAYQEQRGRGSVPGSLTRKAADMLHPKVDPCKELAARIKYCVDSTNGFGTYTYQRPNRRQPAGGAMLPAHRKPIPRVTVIIDTSGSMGKADLDQALGVVGNALRSLPDPRGLRVLVGGTRVEAAKNVFRADQLELLDGGGTEMPALIKAACEENPPPKGIICITDGETGWCKEPVAPRVVVALTRKPTYCPMPPAWMEVVVLNPED
jgi:predicted metal-dependent peptidase